MKLTNARPLTVAEVKAHPEYLHVDWNLQPTKKADVTVAQSRGGPFKLAYEIHGHGPHKILWIMGLGGWMRAWQRQTKDFGHLQADKYSCLIFDNRGIGASDQPLLRYTTSEMAKDVVELLEHVGWTEERSVHVCGISMGGMIAQELALQIPNRISSLNLISTAPRIVRTLPYLENLRNRINLMIPKSLDVQIDNLKHDCYSDAWLSQPDESEHTVSPFPTNGDRICAGEVDKRTTPGALTRTGFLCQLAAAGFHYKSAEQLKQLGDAVGRERILVVHGKQDRMIGFVHGEMLLRELGGEESGVTKSFHEGLGHVMPIEMRKEFRELIEGRLGKCAAL
nr:hypothetical protein B0A51_13086 [Rachicladosporium sp. CCFEE 5018]